MRKFSFSFQLKIPVVVGKHHFHAHHGHGYGNGKPPELFRRGLRLLLALLIFCLRQARISPAGIISVK